MEKDIQKNDIERALIFRTVIRVVCHQLGCDPIASNLGGVIRVDFWWNEAAGDVQANKRSHKLLQSFKNIAI